MLQRIEPESRETCIRLLMWVAMSYESLSFEALADVIGCTSTQSINQEQATLDEIAVCSPIIDVQGKGVGFVHQSAKDYLLRPDVDSNLVLKAFRIKPEDAYRHFNNAHGYSFTHC